MLRLPRAILDDLLAHAREDAPREACGLLAGARDDHQRVVARSFRVRNAHAAPTREYLLDPEEQLRVTMRVEDELKLDVLGFYHSHPAGPARFSRLDIERATWPGATYLLVHLAPREGWTAATWDGRVWAEERVEVTGVGAPSR